MSAVPREHAGVHEAVSGADRCDGIEANRNRCARRGQSSALRVRVDLPEPAMRVPRSYRRTVRSRGEADTPDARRFVIAVRLEREAAVELWCASRRSVRLEAA